jgi:hypothetical protein
MNYKTSFYGFIGLASTIGKHASGIGEKINSFNKEYTCHYAQKVVDGAFVVAGKVSEYSASLGG